MFLDKPRSNKVPLAAARAALILSRDVEHVRQNRYHETLSGVFRDSPVPPSTQSVVCFIHFCGS